MSQTQQKLFAKLLAAHDARDAAAAIRFDEAELAVTTHLKHSTNDPDAVTAYRKLREDTGMRVSAANFMETRLKHADDPMHPERRSSEFFYFVAVAAKCKALGIDDQRTLSLLGSTLADQCYAERQNENAAREGELRLKQLESAPIQPAETMSPSLPFPPAKRTVMSK